ncbi:hypothetical protein [Rhizobium sp. BK176]|uniref:hypothetical protein n=1 Tax=Rhizobium sp. BK176 TaxID=2587071 RepID=UPI00216A74DD|nr:hypothetical protein [Rhizobium sp. BK176]MCS4089463.1 hypothetical protein [Rhizobium sp. BK176]
MDIEQVSAFFHETCGLSEDPSIDPEDHMAVIDAAFLSSDCDDFAWVLSKITGWTAKTAIWNMGMCQSGHHSVVEAPDGRLLDVTGWTDLASIARRVGKEERLVTLHEFRHYPFNFAECDDDEFLEALLAVFDVVDRAPYDGPEFRSLLSAYRDKLPPYDEPVGTSTRDFGP